MLLYASRASVDIAVNLLRARENVTYGRGGRVDGDAGEDGEGGNGERGEGRNIGTWES